MFEAGYEQYLPIERVIIHPNYSFWTADLALIHTFAGMMSDKPGRIVPLANEKTNTPVLSNVVVFSWNPYKLNDTTGLRTLSTINIFLDKKKRLRQRRKRIKAKLRQNTMDDGDQIKYNPKESSLEARSRYRHQNIRDSHSNVKHFNSKTEQLSWERQKDNFERVSIKERITQRNRYTKKPYGVMPYHKNGWRRKIGDQANSGAPAMRRGHLLAVTIAGVDFEGERVAIGIKISCFCSWISENIPKSGTNLVCCKNCCDKKEDIDYNSQYIKLKASK
ncbi:unnamed protein product [Danaus chrysippus]|uniref:(African queen) hypothetical protein n=1 Tax=Danaus chrysippus TaxID=151541 RepID=A0A8J2R3T7_9NEOP|nr:unnamed protein product [Danaus chrysippus]